MDKIKVVVKIGNFKFNTETQQFRTKITVKIFSIDKYLPKICWSEKDIMYKRLNDRWGEYNKNGEEKWREKSEWMYDADIDKLRERAKEEERVIVETLQEVINHNRENNAKAAETAETIREYYL